MAEDIFQDKPVEKKFYKFDKVFDPGVPTALEVRAPQGWINFGVDNQYPQFIIELFNKSAMNKACIMSKFMAVLGGGLKTKDEAQDALLEYASDNCSWQEEFGKIALDYLIFGGFAAHVIWNNEGTAIAEMYHIDFSNVRSGSFDPIYDDVRYYWVSYDWTKVKRAEYKPRHFHKYDPSMAEECPSQIFYYHDRVPGQKFYPLPHYSGGLTSVMSDIELDSHHCSNLKQGLFPGMIINMNNGSPGPIERNAIYEDIASSFSGGAGAGRFFLSFNDSKDTQTEIVPVPPVGDSYLLNLEQRLSSRILSSHRITSPKIVGVFTADSGTIKNSTKDELIIDFEFFKETVIVPLQKILLSQMNRLFKAMYGPDASELIIEPVKLFPGIEDGALVKQDGDAGDAGAEVNVAPTEAGLNPGTANQDQNPVDTRVIE